MVVAATSGVRRGLGVALVVGMTLCCGGQAQARWGHGYHHPFGHRLYSGYYHYWPPYYYWPSYYYWPYYWPYTPYDSYGRPYAPSERRRFPVPAFRLPGLFHYLGALAKDEPIASTTEQLGTTPPQSSQKATKP